MMNANRNRHTPTHHRHLPSSSSSSSSSSSRRSDNVFTPLAVSNLLTPITSDALNYFALKAFYEIYIHADQKKVYFNMKCFEDLLKCLLVGIDCDNKTHCAALRQYLLDNNVNFKKQLKSAVALIYENTDRMKIVHNKLPTEVNGFVSSDLVTMLTNSKDFNKYLKRVTGLKSLFPSHDGWLIRKGDFNFFSNTTFTAEWKYPFNRSRIIEDEFILPSGNQQEPSTMSVHYMLSRKPTVKMAVFNQDNPLDKYTVMHIPYKNPNLFTFIYMPHSPDKDLKEIVGGFYDYLPVLNRYLDGDGILDSLELNHLCIPEDAFNIVSKLGNIGPRIRDINTTTQQLFERGANYPYIFNGGAKQFDISKSTLGMYSSISNFDQVGNNHEYVQKSDGISFRNDGNTVMLNRPFIFMNIIKETSGNRSRHPPTNEKNVTILDIGLYYPENYSRYNSQKLHHIQISSGRNLDIFWEADWQNFEIRKDGWDNLKKTKINRNNQSRSLMTPPPPHKDYGAVGGGGGVATRVTTRIMPALPYFIGCINDIYYSTPYSTYRFRNFTLDAVNCFNLRVFSELYKCMSLKYVYFNMKSLANLFECLLRGVEYYDVIEDYKIELREHLPRIMESVKGGMMNSVTGLIYKDEDGNDDKSVHSNLRKMDNFVAGELHKDVTNYESYLFADRKEYNNLLFMRDFNFFSKTTFNTEWKYPFTNDQLLFDSFILPNMPPVSTYYILSRKPKVKLGVFNRSLNVPPIERFTIMHIPYSDPNYFMFIWMPDPERDLKELVCEFCRRLPGLYNYMREDAFPEVELNNLFIPYDAFNGDNTLGNIGSIIKDIDDNHITDWLFEPHVKYPRIFDGGETEFDINKSSFSMQSCITNTVDINRAKVIKDIEDPNDEKTVVLDSPFIFMNVKRIQNWVDPSKHLYEEEEEEQQQPPPPVILDIGLYYPSSLHICQNRLLGDSVTGEYDVDVFKW